LIAAAVLLPFGLVLGNATFFEMQSRQMHHSWFRLVGWITLNWLSWALLTPPIAWLQAEFPIERKRWWSVPVHILAALILSLAKLSASVWTMQVIEPFWPIQPHVTFIQNLRDNVIQGIPRDIIVYGVILAVLTCVEYSRQIRDREVKSAQLEGLLSEAQVVSLRTQLQPHFLFNTLNGAVALVRENENESATKMLIGLSDMLRYSLETAEQQEVTLDQELEFLSMYLKVEGMRFPDRLTITESIDPAVHCALVPSVLLQPLVENSIRHGIACRVGKGQIWISAHIVGSRLSLVVSDDGVGLPANWSLSNSEGIGLANTRDRLSRLYGVEQSFDVSPRAGGGVDVRISLPYHREPMR